MDNRTTGHFANSHEKFIVTSRAPSLALGESILRSGNEIETFVLFPPCLHSAVCTQAARYSHKLDNESNFVQHHEEIGDSTGGP